jgi:capsular polysaccharide export protein
LLLQGPLGPFFQALSKELADLGHSVCKVNFNAGDAAWLCTGDNVVFSDEPESWDTFLRRLVKKRNIEAVVCYGDCRFYHRVAASLCKQLEIAFWALEEGYLRPDFITMEHGGVNAFSPLYAQRDELVEHDWPVPYQAQLVVGRTFARRAGYAIRYHLRKLLQHRHYPDYVSHRPWNAWQEARGWVMGGVTKWQHQRPDRQLMRDLEQHRGKIFFVPLQVTEDFQIREHSDLSGIEEMVTQVISSFAHHAQADDILLFKHHPMDRGYVSYRAQIDSLSQMFNLRGRVFYGYELPLPALYPLLKGVVTINSTVGLSALLHRVPTFCIGRALYDIDGLTSQLTLAHFWRHQSPVCPKRFERLRQSLLHLTQLNASFYHHLEHSTRLVARRISGLDQVRLPTLNYTARAVGE